LDLSKIETEDAPRALGPYSQGIELTSGSLVFVSGQLGVDAESGRIVGDTIEKQTEQCLRNISAIIGAAGGDGPRLVKTTVYLKRLEDFAGMNEAYSRFMKPPYPARSCVAGCDLPKGALVEIEAIAVL
jgi:2-iminobutanoate/2-iminopropanoate deaminase